MTRWLLLLCLLLLPARWSVAGEPVRHLAYEAVPAGATALEAAPYAARQAIARRVAAEIVPAVIAALGIEPASAATELTVGGYRLHLNPALHTVLKGADEPAGRLAAALGWVLHQDSVLLADLAANDGDTEFAMVRLAPDRLAPDRLPPDRPDPEGVRRFFVHAAAVHPPLGDGFTALGGGALLFLDLSHTGGLIDGLRRAATGFPAASLGETGQARAQLVDNDWRRYPAGDAYVVRLPAASLPALGPLRARHARLVQACHPPPPAPSSPPGRGP
jgi:hypothetical protein